MTEITTILSQAAANLASWQAAAASAASAGAAKTQAAEAAWAAVAAIEAATAQAEGRRSQILASNDAVAAALAARVDALAKAEAARSEGDPPPLAEATASALRDALAASGHITPASTLDGALKAPVDAIDIEIAALDDTAASQLDAALGTLETQVQAYQAKQALAGSVLASVESAPARIAADLEVAQVLLEATRQRADGGHIPAAVVAYVDYQAARARLAAAATGAAASALQSAWESARDAQLSALADLLDAQATVIQRRLELANQHAEQGARQATRDAVAASAVDAVLNPPPPPGP